MCDWESCDIGTYETDGILLEVVIDIVSRRNIYLYIYIVGFLYEDMKKRVTLISRFIHYFICDMHQVFKKI